MQIDDLRPGLELGPGSWKQIEQARIDAFADATEDHQWIHVDPGRAAQGPFGTTIAHGYLTLSLIVPFASELLQVDDASLGVNYGLDRVRFPAPVPVGSRLRASLRVADVKPFDGGVQATIATTIEREDGDKPVCVAEVVFRYYR